MDFFPTLPPHLIEELGPEAYYWMNYALEFGASILFFWALFRIGTGLLVLAGAHRGTEKRRSVAGSLDAISHALEKPADYVAAKE